MVRIVNVGHVARRATAAVPAVVLAATGVAFASLGAAAEGPSGVHVPDTALTGGASPLYPEAGPAPAPMQLPPIYRTYTDDPARTAVPEPAQAAIHAIDPVAPVLLDANGIPAAALGAYRHAADLLRSVDPGCGVDWALLGAIGRVESNHARFGGNVLDTAGVARPGIIGVPLDGSRGTARITDTDGGRWDRDTSFDRAVGPMQFIPGTWRVVGQDGNGDGVADPQNMVDAATSAGAYLCSGNAVLTGRDGAYEAVLRYNHSDAYARTVLAIADAYRSGVTVLPSDALPAARPAEGFRTGTPDGSGFGWGGSSTPQDRPGATQGRAAKAKERPRPSGTPTRTATAGPSPVPASPTPTASTTPSTTTSRAALPSLPVPALPLPGPSTPAPSPTSPSLSDLLALAPCRLSSVTQPAWSASSTRPPARSSASSTRPSSGAHSRCAG